MTISDIKVVQNDQGLWDIVFENGGVAIDESLDSIITYLLFTNAFDNDFPVDQKQGWSGGFLTSYLWQYKHHVLTTDVLLEVEEVTRDALQPLLDNKIVSNIEVLGEIDKSAGTMKIVIEYFQIKAGEIGKYYMAYQQTSIQ